ncbi:prephenate dehydrogenase/arogenate dehydrogenase family protein [Pseudothauera nasutitermitis]|uniref:prephenate dehydrogenase n=1 Tax=Pseudothauera nasutitermitis TaxID=2565930 RepID=A0A4S4B0A4_9RHOO|nr:prephenate dehydrogenase/arogenate dehydrogenase family protein [Pseudothauera nasutitermitis]THF65776.1 prephenate dehydrogenase/arogenate dehydrogenase family protein [Pseudothauera nasutitermitis]
MAPIGKLVVCGAGLIGGSFALALRRAGAVGRIVGIGRSTASLEHAREMGAIDEIAAGWAEALDGADLVLLAAPVGQMDAIMAAMAPHLGPDTLVTDAGSTKRDVIEAIYRHLGARLGNVVPAHPIAGAEKSGAGAAFAELYDGKKVVVTPLPENTPEAIERVRAAWAACGAQIHQMSPAEHDRVFAAVSHLPHLLAFGLVHDLAGRANAEQLFSYAASGFRDFTRIAGSHPEMWRDICIANRQALLGELDQYLAELAYLRALLLAGDAPRLEKLFEEARAARNAWAERQTNIVTE